MLNSRDNKLIEVAKSIALTSRHHKAHVGAVIADGRDILSVGVNGRKSHPLQQKYNRLKFTDNHGHHLMHAELEAIVKGRAQGNKLAGTTMYVYRLMKTGMKGMSRPCVGCMQALKDFGIHRVMYTTEDGIADETLM